MNLSPCGVTGARNLTTVSSPLAGVTSRKRLILRLPMSVGRLAISSIGHEEPTRDEGRPDGLRRLCKGQASSFAERADRSSAGSTAMHPAAFRLGPAARHASARVRLARDRAIHDAAGGARPGSQTGPARARSHRHCSPPRRPSSQRPSSRLGQEARSDPCGIERSHVRNSGAVGWTARSHAGCPATASDLGPWRPIRRRLHIGRRSGRSLPQHWRDLLRPAVCLQPSRDPDVVVHPPSPGSHRRS